MTTEEARTRVARGAAHLDRVRPGWADRIDVGTLTLWDPCGCIVGQLCGTAFFEAGLASLQLDDFALARLGGFDVGIEDEPMPPYGRSRDEFRAWVDRNYGPLQDAWLEEIATRVIVPSEVGVPVVACP